MKYLLIISHDDAFVPSDTLVTGIVAWIERVRASGARVHGNPLRPAGEAMTMRVRNGRLQCRPGPFARSKEKMCAYELLECASLDEAIGLASEHPMASAATIEVRPVWQELAG